MIECQKLEKEDKVAAALIFRREELLYDIRNLAFVEGDLMPDDLNHNRHVVQDIGEDGNIDRVTRILDLTIARCREMLFPYTKHELHELVLDDRLRNQKIYGIVLTLPKSFSQTTLSLLEHFIHELLVCEAVTEWMRIANPGKAASWKEKAEETAKSIKRHLNGRLDHPRIRQHWLV